MDPPVSVQVTSEELQKVAKDAASQAVADAEELMEAVMQETVRLLRPEFAELATIKDETADLKQAVAQLTEQQLDFAIKDQVNKQVANLLALCSQIKDEVAVRPKIAHDHKGISDLQTRTSQIKAESSQEQLAELKAQIEEMRTQLSRISVPPDSITPRDLEASREMTLSALQAHGAATLKHVDKRISEFNAELSRIESLQAASLSTLKEVAAKDYVDEQISSLRACLPQIKREPANEHFSESNGQMQEAQAKLSECTVPSDIVTRSALESVKEGIFSQLQGHKEHVDKKILQLQAQVFDKIKRDEGPSSTELRRQSEATKQNVDIQISVLRSDGSELKENLAQRTDKSEAVTRADLDGMREFLISQMTQVSENVQDLRKLAHGFHLSVQKDLQALSEHVVDIRKHSTRGDLDMLVKVANQEHLATVRDLRKLAHGFHLSVQKELKAFTGHVADNRKQSKGRDLDMLVKVASEELVVAKKNIVEDGEISTSFSPAV